MSDDPLHRPHDPRDDAWAALSSMADGEASVDAQERCLAMWSEQSDARARWRQYQLIGDVLRSRELARDDAHDAAFLAALRTRMAGEPVVLHRARPVLLSRLRAWAAPMAAAAGVAAVAAVVVMMRATPGATEGTQIAARQPAAQPVASAVAVTAVQLQQPVNGRLIRDARLDRYFAAHRQSGTGAAVQMPGGVVRSVDTIVLEDR